MKTKSPPTFKAKAKQQMEDLNGMAEVAKDMFHKAKDLNAMIATIKAYNEVTATARQLIIYKKMTSIPKQIEFFED